MNRIKLKTLVFVVLLIQISLIPAVYAKNDVLRETLIKSADLHLSRQGTYTNTCGDLYGSPYAQAIPYTWEWSVGSGSTCWNTGGTSATGLLAAYEVTGNEMYLDAALLTGDALVWRYKEITKEGSQWEDRPFSQDIEFLVRLCQDSIDDYYCDYAEEWYKIITDNKTPEANVDRYIDARNSLAGWGVASHIRAASAVGEEEYAESMAEYLIEHQSDWEGIPFYGWDYTVSSHSSLLWAFAEINSDSFQPYVSEILVNVLDSQSSDGSFDSGDYQVTAYAILGLTAQGTAIEERSAAVGYLLDKASADGGWGYPTYGEYSEVNSEVITAIAGMRDFKSHRVSRVLLHYTQ